MTNETILRRLSKVCRENIDTFGDPDNRPEIRGPYGHGQADGTVQTSQEMLVEIRKLRREIRRKEA